MLSERKQQKRCPRMSSKVNEGEIKIARKQKKILKILMPFKKTNLK